MEKFLSRKFALGIAAFVALILATSGVIDQGEEVQVVEALAIIFAIVMQGIVDARS